MACRSVELSRDALGALEQDTKKTVASRTMMLVFTERSLNTENRRSKAVILRGFIMGFILFFCSVPFYLSTYGILLPLAASRGRQFRSDSLSSKCKLT